jgi:hypothetical protein
MSFGMFYPIIYFHQLLIARHLVWVTLTRMFSVVLIMKFGY